MRLVFAGTPGFAVPAFHALLAAGHDVAEVYTQPDRRAGRGRAPRPSPVKAVARELGIGVRQPLRLDDAERDHLRTVEPDLVVVVAYGLLVPESILSLPHLGCVNVHASLLPRWRGAAPIQRAIEAGDAVTGITLMQMDSGLDTGDILTQVEEPVAATDTAGSLQERLAVIGARILVDSLPAIDQGTIRPRVQDEAGVVYAPKVDKAEAQLDWHQDADVLERRIRAFDPAPVAWTSISGQRVRVWRAALDGDRNDESAGTVPGTVLRADTDGIVVHTGRGRLRLTRLQRPGGRPLDAGAFLRGFAVEAGMRIE
jgi:methionyl-tRNA formyltransferase